MDDPVQIVTVGTDGFRDYVRTPDGVERNLGAVSVLTLVVEAAADVYEARDIVKTFLSKGEAMFAASTAVLNKLLQPKRAIWAQRKPFYSEPTQGKRYAMDAPTSEAVSQAVEAINRQIAILQKQIQENGGLTAQIKKDDIDRLRDLISNLKNPEGAIKGKDQSSNATYYKLASNGQYVPVELPAAPVASEASVGTLETNSLLVEATLAKIAKVGSKITALVGEGRKFNATKAREDLYYVAATMNHLLNTADLAQPFVTEEVTKLANQAGKIHDLFFPPGK